MPDFDPRPTLARASSDERAETKLRVVSLVPSWTETLIECGVRVVGRSRFCVHPASRVDAIPKIGGTKDVDWKKLETVTPDRLVLDREENTREMAESSPVPTVVTHIRGISDCGDALRLLARELGRATDSTRSSGGSQSSPEGTSARLADAGARGSLAAEPRRQLAEIAARWDRVGEADSIEVHSWDDLPGVLDWIHRPSVGPREGWSVVYLIWQEPWMTVDASTFIGTVLAKLGLGPMHVRGLTALEASGRYPRIELERLDPERTLLLCSSEPFPFARKRARIESLGFAAAIVDGESYSWFGLRSLRFLESALRTDHL